MKMLLGIALFIVCVHSAALIKSSTGTTGLPKFDVTVTSGLRNRRYAEKPDLSLINEMRREVARAGGITMPDLEWDEQLVAAAKNMDSDCAKLAHGPNYRYFMDGANENSQKIIAFLYTVLLALDQMDNIPLTKNQSRVVNIETKQNFEVFQSVISFILIELFNPAQTKIGCAQSRCDGVFPEDIAKQIGMDGLTYSFDIMCAIGPHPLWDEAQLQKVEYAARQVKVMDKKSFIDFSKPALDEGLPQEEPPEAIQYTHPPPPPRSSPKPPTTPESANGESQKDTESSGSSTSFQLAFLLSLLAFLM